MIVYNINDNFIDLIMNISILKLVHHYLLLIYYILGHTYSSNIFRKILSFFGFNLNLFFLIQRHNFSLLQYCFYSHLQCFDVHLSYSHSLQSLTFLLLHYFLTQQLNSYSLLRNFLVVIIYFMILTQYLSFHELSFCLLWYCFNFHLLFYFKFLQFCLTFLIILCFLFLIHYFNGC